MSNRTVGLSELIQRLKHDGIVAGEGERDKILEHARIQGQKIIDDATKKANDLINQAQTQCIAKTAHMESELKMAARDFLLKFKNELRQKIIQPTVQAKVASAASDDEFIKNCLKDLVLEYATVGNGQIEAVVSKQTKEKLVDFFKSELSKELAGKSMPILTSEDSLSGFKLKQSGQNFVWDFSVEAISQELSRLVDPTLAVFLMGEEKKQLKPWPKTA